MAESAAFAAPVAVTPVHYLIASGAPRPIVLAAASAPSSKATAYPTSSWAGWAALIACVATAAGRTRRCSLCSRSAKGSEATQASRRSIILPAAAVLGLAASAEEALAETQVPPKINEDPYALLGVTPGEKLQEKKEFKMKEKYKQDTEQLLKHMKIAGSLEKGTPNMERYNLQVKRELNDWVALYRRQDRFSGRQSFYTVYTAVEYIASHYTSYGPKFPFPNKKKKRYYELINEAEKYLEKSK